MSGISTTRAANFTANGIVDGTSEKTKIEIAITKSRKLVPQRGWSVDFVRAFSTVRSSFASNVYTVLCSAPWYWKTRRISFM